VKALAREAPKLDRDRQPAGALFLFVAAVAPIAARVRRS